MTPLLLPVLWKESRLNPRSPRQGVKAQKDLKLSGRICQQQRLHLSSDAAALLPKSLPSSLLFSFSSCSVSLASGTPVHLYYLLSFHIHLPSLPLYPNLLLWMRGLIRPTFSLISRPQSAPGLRSADAAAASDAQRVGEHAAGERPAHHHQVPAAARTRPRLSRRGSDLQPLLLFPTQKQRNEPR